MRKAASTALAALALLLASSPAVHAGEPYFPYKEIESYFDPKPDPVPSQPPPSQLRPDGPVKATPRVEPPLVITQPPVFLFPRQLGFGVAVGVPYDLFYLSGIYYYARGNAWYRSSSYQGPWTALGYHRLPPELRKHKLAEIRVIRNREFTIFWKNMDGYSGKSFRPGKGAKEHQGEGR